MDKDTTLIIKNLFADFTDECQGIFDTTLQNAFIVATYIFSLKTLPYFQSLSSEANETIETYFNKFKTISYDPYEMRRAFSESYLLSLRDLESYTVNVTLELPLQYLRTITDAIASNLNYDHNNILNANGNIGNLALALALSEHIEPKDLYVTVVKPEELRLAKSLRTLSRSKYTIQDVLPSLSFRADIIVSDPFLRKIEDILVFFEDYTEYLNNHSFMIVTLPTEYIRDRVFSDSLEKHSLVLIGIIEYPEDILEGLIKSSIVILEKKDTINKEFFHVSMPSIKDIESNFQVMDELKKYINEYLGEN